MRGMKAIPMRTQLGLVAAAYAAVLVTAAVLIYERHMQYVRNPQDAAASSGMYAGGDLILELFIGCMVLAPTVILVFVLRKSEELYTRYAKVLLGVSVTAPVCLGLFLIPAVSQGTSRLGEICVDRLFASPLVLAGLVFSRLLARFDRAKKLITNAVMVEALTLILMVGWVLFPGFHKGA
jgi:hypothetical protein